MSECTKAKLEKDKDRLDPKTAIACYNMGFLYMKNNDLLNAITNIDNAIKIL